MNNMYAKAPPGQFNTIRITSASNASLSINWQNYVNIPTYCIWHRSCW
jgi:hypothetical protein